MYCKAVPLSKKKKKKKKRNCFTGALERSPRALHVSRDFTRKATSLETAGEREVFYSRHYSICSLINSKNSEQVRIAVAVLALHILQANIRHTSISETFIGYDKKLVQLTSTPSETSGEVVSGTKWKDGHWRPFDKCYLI